MNESNLRLKKSEDRIKQTEYENSSIEIESAKKAGGNKQREEWNRELPNEEGDIVEVGCTGIRSK